MHDFGVFGLVPINPDISYHQGGSYKSKVAGKECVTPITPKVMKEKLITLFLLVASIPLAFMICSQ